MGDMNMKMKLLSRLKGYQRLGRERHTIAKDCGLDDSEYRLWDLLGSCTIWDSKKTAYGTLEATQAALANILGLGWSISKVSRRFHSLHNKGMISIIEDGVYEVHHLPDYQLMPKEVAGVQVDQPIGQKINSLAGEVVAPVQRDLPRLTNTSLGSFKVSEGLAEDDVRWLEENVR
jgi:hypothetical protein